jgi:AcrR family transcriptional regulator
MVSNGLLDLRVRRTYKFLWDALRALMAERDFESITVTDICERAMVHRTTFYKHYEDKYGLLFHGIQDELSALFDSVDVAEGEHRTNHRTWLIAAFEHVGQHDGFYRLMLSSEGSGKFSTMLQDSFAERLEKRIQHEVKHSMIPATLHAQLQAASMVAVMAWWLKNNCPYTPAEMIQHIFEHINLV